MRVHVVANPTAGRGRVPGLVAVISSRLTAAGATVSLHMTTGPGDATAHVAGLAPVAADRLVVVGGDGTLHEVVNALPPPLPWPVVVVPVGTANLVAREAGMPLSADPDRVAASILGGRLFAADLLSTGDRGYGVANVGAGLDAEVVHAVAAARRGRLGGYARWVMPIARTIVGYRQPSLEVIVEGKALARGGSVVVQNTHNYGGLLTLSPWARMDDGRLDVVVMRRATRRDHFRMLLGAFLARLAHDRGIAFAKGTRVEIRPDSPVAVQMDGDPAGTTPITIRLVRAALTLVRGVA